MARKTRVSFIRGIMVVADTKGLLPDLRQIVAAGFTGTRYHEGQRVQRVLSDQSEQVRHSYMVSRLQSLISTAPNLPAFMQALLRKVRKPQHEMNLEDEVFGKCIVFFPNNPQIESHSKIGKRM